MLLTTDDDVYITGELYSRAAKEIDHLQEKLALQDLATRMADQPGEVLPRFVDLAMQITDGVSAGLSIYEEEPAPGVFRWTCLRGTLERFNGATTPRNFSPCGVTLDQNRPVLCRHPERVYDWISEASIVVPEVLLVPLYIDGATPLGTLWIVSDELGHFDSGHARVASELAAFVDIALRMLKTERQLQEALAAQRTLTQEMSHRIKNLFAVTQGIVRFSAKGSDTKDDMVRVLSSRLHALANADALVRRDFSRVGQGPRASDLASLIRAVLEPHDHLKNGGKQRFVLQGSVVPCGDHAINGIALIINELATNAAKYGALAADDGQIEITWKEEAGDLIVRWVETGGQQIESPPADGFGGTLIRTVVVQQFGGKLDYDWLPTGVAVHISVPLASLSA